MQVEVNGVDQEIPTDTTLSGLLSQLNIQQERVAVELNLAVINRNQFNASLKEGDKIEIINFVGGGGGAGHGGEAANVRRSGVTNVVAQNKIITASCYATG